MKAILLTLAVFLLPCCAETTAAQVRSDHDDDLAAVNPSNQSVGGSERLPAGFPVRRGPFAFFNAAVFTDPVAQRDTIAWVSRFELLVTNGDGLADAETLKQLHSQGCRLFLYFWTNGFYAFEVERSMQDGPWRKELGDTRRNWLLSAEPQVSQMGPPAHYFDLGNPDTVDFLCGVISRYRQKTGYDGVFFDYASQVALPPPVLASWVERHPALPYDRALANFWRKLREVDPGIVIFTNQAYQSKEPVLLVTDWDMTESAGTSHAWGPKIAVQDVWGPVPEAEDGQLLESFFRPWSGEHGIEAIYQAIERRLAATATRQEFVYLDYFRPYYRPAEDGTLRRESDVEAVYYSYCAAALWGRSSYCSEWFGGGAPYRGPLYFADLGKPLGSRPRQVGNIALREYERGLVALMTSTDTAEAACPFTCGSEGTLWDLYAGVPVRCTNGVAPLRLEASLAPMSRTLRPSGRVYLKQ